MRSRIVPSSELSTSSLLAKDYVYSPKVRAGELLKTWMEDNPGFMHGSTPAMKDLRTKLEAELRAALDSGIKGGKDACDHELEKTGVQAPVSAEDQWVCKFCGWVSWR